MGTTYNVGDEVYYSYINFEKDALQKVKIKSIRVYEGGENYLLDNGQWVNTEKLRLEKEDLYYKIKAELVELFGYTNKDLTFTITTAYDNNNEGNKEELNHPTIEHLLKPETMADVIGIVKVGNTFIDVHVKTADFEYYRLRFRYLENIDDRCIQWNDGMRFYDFYKVYKFYLELV